MALILCKICGRQISKNAKICPGCGEKQTMGFWKIVGISFLILVGAGIIGSFIDEKNNSKAKIAEQKRIDSLSPEKRDAEIKRKLLEKKNSENRAINASFAISNLQSTLNDSDSLKLEWVGVNDSGNVICIDYRAKNSYGGYVKEYITYLNNKPYKSADIWNLNCANKPLQDYKHMGAMVK